MNSRTRQDMDKFIEQVEVLAVAVVLHTGTQTASEVCQACENLRQSLAQDETIVESGVGQHE